MTLFSNNSIIFFNNILIVCWEIVNSYEIEVLTSIVRSNTKPSRASSKLIYWLTNCGPPGCRPICRMGYTCLHFDWAAVNFAIFFLQQTTQALPRMLHRKNLQLGYIIGTEPVHYFNVVPNESQIGDRWHIFGNW